MRTPPFFIVLAAALCASAPAFADGRGGAPAQAPAPRAETPLEALAAANAAARQGPARESFRQARQVYPYREGALYQLYANPSYVSAILLEPGEQLLSIAAGDTQRWSVSQAESERQSAARTIVLVKPQAENLATNIVLVTDRRSYIVEAASHARGAYSAEIAWSYPAPAAPAASPHPAALDFAYRIRTVRGREPAWTPAQAFDDGRRTFIVFPADIAASEMPPLFVLGPEGLELVNTRIEGRTLIVERLFDRAELRLGARAQTIVRIERARPPEPRMMLRRGGRR